MKVGAMLREHAHMRTHDRVRPMPGLFFVEMCAFSEILLYLHAFFICVCFWAVTI